MSNEIGEKELLVKKNYKSRPTVFSAHRITNIKHFPVVDVGLTISAVGRAAGQDQVRNSTIPSFAFYSLLPQ